MSRPGAVVDPAIRTSGLTKHFGHQVAVDDLDLVVPRGSVFGFLGPNGSGKTTTIRLLLGLASATSGSARVLDHDVPRGLPAALPRVGALIEGPAFYPFLSGAANLRRLDAADPHADPRTRSTRVSAALERVGLTRAAGKKVRAYSLGMKQRLGIAAALLAPRELVVLDEPTNGLDPQGTREVRALVRTLADDGATVLVSSHLLAEVEQVCTHAAVMQTGRLRAQGSLAELRTGRRARVRVRTPDAGVAAGELARLGLTAVAGVTGETVEAEVPAGSAEVPAVEASGVTPVAQGHDAKTEGPVSGVDGWAPERIVAALVAAGVRVRGFELLVPTLEELFVDLTGEGFDLER